MSFRYCILLPLFMLLWITSAQSQRLIERGMTLNPLENPAVDVQKDEVAWFPQVGGWVSFGNYGAYSDENHAWYQHLGGYFEMYRRGNESSFAVTSQIEFIADTNNDINFSPRAIFWEEGLLYTRNIGGPFLQVGYYHRCKHDIDNLRFGEERTMVFGSALAKLIMPFSLRNEGDALISFQYDHYTITWEKRTPDTFESSGKDWDNLVNSFKVNAAWQRQLQNNAMFYIDGYGMATLLKDDFWMNAQIRAEIGSRTPAGEVRFGIHIEHLGDSGIPVEPVSVTLAGIGLRIMTPGSIR